MTVAKKNERLPGTESVPSLNLMQRTISATGSVRCVTVFLASFRLHLLSKILRLSQTAALTSFLSCEKLLMNEAAPREDLKRRASGGSFQNKLANKRRKAGDVDISFTRQDVQHVLLSSV